MRRGISASAGAIALLVALLAAPLTAAATATTATTATTAATDSGLSEQGEMAVDDLRSCVASSDTLNVYYLVDNSKSLRQADDGGPGSDPQKLRVKILANSLEQLGKLRDGLTVNWAAGIFSNEFTGLLPFAELGERGAQALSDELDKAVPDGYTNWPAGLENAQKALQEKYASTPGACQLLISLTDSQIDISSPEGVDGQDFAALEVLCNGGGPNEGGGIFNEFRQNGVVVIGALVGPDASATTEGRTLKALIEGSNDGGEKTCGTNPVPDDPPWVHGAFVPAEEFDSLARVFQTLGAEVSGGSECWAPGNPLWIDPGVSRFRVIAGGDWTLSPPASSDFDGELTATVEAGNAPEWATEVGPRSFDVDTSGQEAPSEWTLSDAISPQIFCFSDMSVEFLSKTIPLDETGDTAGNIKAQLKDPEGANRDLKDFRSDYTLDVRFPGLSGESAPEVVSSQVDAETGEIDIFFRVPEENTSSQFDVEVALDGLKTSAHNLELASVPGSETISVDLPAEFPSIESVQQTTPLEGRNGVGVVSMRVVGPAAGGEGQVCVTGDPVIGADLEKNVRATSWEWTTPDDCITVPSGESKTIELTVTNDEPADSTVEAAVPVRLTSTNGEERPLDVPFTFQTTHPINLLAVVLITLALLALGILLPLVGLWILNRRTTRLDIDQSIQRAALPVRITSDGAIIEAPAGDTALSEKFTYRGAARGVRSISDPDLGRIAAVVPWFPLLPPSYRLSPPDGRVIVAARTGARGASTAERRRDGSLRFSQLPFEAFWGIVISRSDLISTKRGDELRGTAVLYHAQTASGPTQYRDRLSAIGHDTTIVRAIEHLREQMRDNAGRDDAKQATGGGPGGVPTSSPPGSPNPTQPSAPSRPGPGSARPGSSTSSPSAPPRPGSAPPRPGSAPPRPGSTPPPAAGGQPPRPSR